MGHKTVVIVVVVVVVVVVVFKAHTITAKMSDHLKPVHIAITQLN